MQNIGHRNTYIVDPLYPVMGQMIHAIDVVEAWGLNHHLSCVLTCISQASSKSFEGTDLKSTLRDALWYLDRFLMLYVEDNLEHTVVTPTTIDVLDVARDWGLDCDLTMAVTHLSHSTQSRPIYHINAAKRFIENKIKHL